MTEIIDGELKKMGVTISKPMLAVICIIFGIMVILFPNLLVWMVGLFLVIQGALLLTDYLEQERRRTTVTVYKGVYCYSCGSRNTEEAVYCKRCGKKLIQAGQTTTPEPNYVKRRSRKVKVVSR